MTELTTAPVNELDDHKSPDVFLAKSMAGSALLPTHLRKKKVDGAWVDREQADIVRTCVCLIQAAKAWDFEPMALAMASYEVHGKIDYEGQVYTALANLRAGLRAPLNVEYEYGMGTDKPPTSAKIIGTFLCETQPRVVEVFTARAMKTANTENWKNDPEQQLFYFGCKRWVKRHAPHIAFSIETSPLPTDLAFQSVPALTPSQEAEAGAITNDVPKITSVVTTGKTRGYMHEIDKCNNHDELKAVRRLMDGDDTLTTAEREQIERHGKRRIEKLSRMVPKETEEKVTAEENADGRLEETQAEA